MYISEVTKKNYKQLPHNEYGKEYDFDSILIIPTRRVHSSGFGVMDIVGCVGDEAVYDCSGCYDVLFFDGIGGWGYKFLEKGESSQNVEPKGWKIDMTRHGIMRIFFTNDKHKIRIHPNYCSSFSFYGMTNKKGE